MVGRTAKSIRNMIYSILNNTVGIISIIISRIVFLYVLDAEYLGINTLFTEILSVLSISDLGIGSVMLYSYFEPLANHDEKKLISLTKLYKKIYICISIAVGVIGLLFIPVLPMIVKTEQIIPHLYVYYLIFLANTVVSYLFIYKTTILNADQNNYILSKVNLFGKIILTIVQIIILILTKNNILYLSASLLCTILTNLVQSHYADKIYPFLRESSYPALSNEEKTEIKKSIRDGFIYKISGIFMNSTDNTLISVLINTVTVGIFNNYSYITTQVGKISSILFGNLVGGIGNLIVTEEPEKRKNVFWMLHSISSIISEISIVCLVFLLSDFVRIWLGSEYVLSRFVVYALCCNVYFSISLLPLWLYRDATAMFRKIKYIMLLCGIINLVLSIITGIKWGLAGIILSSAIARFVTYFWYEPLLLFRDFFVSKPYNYYLSHGINIFGILIISILLSIPCGNFIPQNFVEFLLKAIIVFVIVNVLFIIYNLFQKSFRDAFSYFKKILSSYFKNVSERRKTNE